jgi:ArsR family transcriptional regulator
MRDVEQDAVVFKALSDPLRLRLLEKLPGDGDRRTFCVCDLAREVGISQPCLSHHLNILKRAGLIDFEKDGCSVFYYVDKDAVVEKLQRFSEQIQEKT